MINFFRSLFFLSLLFTPLSLHAIEDPLLTIYNSRPDLQAAFLEDSGRAVPGSAAGFLIDLNDWAEQYGWREYPSLASYAPLVPVPQTPATPPPTITANHYIVIHEGSGQILAAQGADEVWPIASLTKLMTAQIALVRGINLEESAALLGGDDVGGAKLYVEEGTVFSLKDLFAAMLIGSANNAANAIARVSGDGFMEAMNEFVVALNLSKTTFVDPTGIDPKNVSTAREVAAFAASAFTFDVVQALTTTVSKSIYSATDGETRALKNTNWLLYYPEYDDVYVTAGKTGYLEESGWNLVVRMRPSAEEKEKELLIVTFGSSSRQESFQDSEALAHWVWEGASF